MRYDAVLAETVGIRGDGDDLVEAYTARPLAPGPRGGVLVIHHMPGYDREAKEIVRRFAEEGYDAICVNLHFRDAPGADPDDAAAASRANGGVPDDRFVGDAAGAVRWLRDLPTSNGRVATIGFCSGDGLRSSLPNRPSNGARRSPRRSAIGCTRMGKPSGGSAVTNAP